MLVTRNWLKEYIGDDIPSTEEIVDLLMMHAFEIEGTESIGEEEVIDVDILPNRASDCLSHRGIAHEISTLTGNQLVYDPLKEEVPIIETDKISIDIEDSKACRRFGAALMTDVAIAESPQWLKNRLEAIGQRPINNVVDATNYVMFSLGQPLHAYDAAKFPQKDGVWKFGVRFAKDEEKIIVLTGEEYELDSSIQLIVDASNDAPAGIAGVKGGKYAEIDTDTNTIILEAANFDPTITRKAAQKLKLQTDASKRFENEPSRDLVQHALREVTKLIADIAGGKFEGSIDEYPTQYTNPEISVSVEKINSLLGLTLTSEAIQKTLNRLGFVVRIEEDYFIIRAPFERTDITIPEDIIEEIGRVHGYDHIVSEVPKPVPLTEFNTRHYYGEKIRNALVAEGFSEIITSSFRNKDEIEMRNYLASDKGYLRSSLQKNISESLERNVFNKELLDVDAIRLFEIGTVFRKNKEGNDVIEHVSLALGVRTKKQGYTPKDDLVLTEIAAKLEVELSVDINFEIKEGVLEINFTDLLSTLPDIETYNDVEIAKEVAYKSYSAFPYISRDLALWVPEDITADIVKEIIQNTAGTLLVQVSLFDEFKKDERVSYAFRLIFQSMERTLTDEEVAEATEMVSSELKNKGYELR